MAVRTRTSRPANAVPAGSLLRKAAIRQGIFLGMLLVRYLHSDAREMFTPMPFAATQVRISKTGKICPAPHAFRAFCAF